MSTRDRRSQRIREQLRARANPRSGQGQAPRSFQEQLKRVYGVDTGEPSQHAAITAELARLTRRRR